MVYRFDNEAFMRELERRCDRSFLQYAGALDQIIVNNVDTEAVETLELLRDSCRLSYYSEGDPYGALFVPVGEGHLCCMTEDQYLALDRVLKEITEDKLRARVADLLWVCGKKLKGKGDIRHALLATSSFSQLPIEETNWFRDGLDKDWRRGLILAKSLGHAAEKDYVMMCERLRNALVIASKTGDPDNLLRWAIPSLLLETGLDDVVPPKVIAAGLEELVRDCKINKSGVLAVSTHSHDAALWWRRAHDEDGFARMEASCAESYIDEAERESQQDYVQWFRAAHFYHAAIITLQGIPRRDRVAFCSEERLAWIEARYETACDKGQFAMRTSSSKTVDVSKIVNWAESSVRGKATEMALQIFVSLYCMKEEDAKNLAIKFLNASVISAIFAKSIIAHGCVVAQAPAYVENGSDGAKERVWLESVQRAGYLLQVACHVALRPAYNVLRDEHLLVLDDFKRLVVSAPLIPSDHRVVFAEAMQLGYEGHFTASTYILAPEIENIIRQQLKIAGFNTTTIDSQTKLPNEVGLSTLIKDWGKEIGAIFSLDFLFELKAIFSDHAGPNVRNEIAHGLKNDDLFNGDVDFYVWWFCLRLLFMRPKERMPKESSHEEGR